MGASRPFALLIDAAPDAMVVVDATGTIVMVNSQAATLFGFAQHDLVGSPIEMLVPERYRGSHVRHRGAFFRTPSARPMGAGLELFGIRKDGTEFPVEISLRPVEIEAGVMALSAIRDTTDRKRAEAKFRGLLESAPDAILIVDRAGRIVLVNAQTEGSSATLARRCSDSPSRCSFRPGLWTGTSATARSTSGSRGSGQWALAWSCSGAAPTAARSRSRSP